MNFSLSLSLETEQEEILVKKLLKTSEIDSGLSPEFVPSEICSSWYFV